jgi:hypothetical protein
MESIHLKTVDPISQKLLLSASQQRLELPWERYEKLQPQDGFLRLGLSCPFGCMQGPCRIDPFGRGPQNGVCGLAKDEMAAGLLLRLCLQGTMDAMAGVFSEDDTPAIRFSPALRALVDKALSSDDQQDLSIDDIIKSNLLLNRPSSTYKTLLSQALRLSLLTLGFQEQASAAASESIPCRIGYGTLTGQQVRIGISGRPSAPLIASLTNAMKEESGNSALLVSLGEWILQEDQFMPIACTSGESELLVSSGAIHLLVAGVGSDPGLIGLCHKLNIPVMTDGTDAAPAEIVEQARKRSASVSQVDLFSAVPSAEVHQVLMSHSQAAAVIKEDQDGRIALIGGSDTLQLSLGRLPLGLATELSGKGVQLGGWGDAALWILKNNLQSTDGGTLFHTLDNRQGPLLVVKGLAGDGRLDRLQGICFAGLKSCQELTAALGLAYLGCRVSSATPIPVRGSSKVTNELSDMLQKNGGELLHFDHPPQPGELSDWLMNY